MLLESTSSFSSSDKASCSQKHCVSNCPLKDCTCDTLIKHDQAHLALNHAAHYNVKWCDKSVNQGTQSPWTERLNKEVWNFILSKIFWGYFFISHKGIRMGDIGGKLGANSTDNGYLILERVRIPRLHMLMKNATVICSACFSHNIPLRWLTKTRSSGKIQITDQFQQLCDLPP